METYNNITKAEYDFDDEAFNIISDEARDFIAKLLVKDLKWELNLKRLCCYNAVLLCLKQRSYAVRRVFESSLAQEEHHT